jgi:hypothetical protein
MCMSFASSANAGTSGRLLDLALSPEVIVVRCDMPKSNALRISYELAKRGIVAFG